MKTNLKTIITKENMEKVVKVVAKYGEIVTPIVVPVVTKLVTEKVVEHITYGRREFNYEDAIKMIIDSNMYSSDKTRVISCIPKELDSDAYKAISKVANSTMYSSNKVETILNIVKSNSKEEKSE